MERWLPKKSPLWSSNGVEWAGSEVVSSLECHEHNVGNLNIEVIGLNWSSEVVALFSRGLGAASSFELPHCQEMRDARKGSSESLGSPFSLCSECQEGRSTSFFHCVHCARVALLWNCHSKKSLSLTVGCGNKGGGCGEGHEGEGT